MSRAPEKLNLWDRLFNRYRKEVAQRGTKNVKWYIPNLNGGQPIDSLEYWVEYRIIDRLTGSETIKRETISGSERI